MITLIEIRSKKGTINSNAKKCIKKKNKSLLSENKVYMYTNYVL